MGQDDNEQYSGLALYLATDYFMDHQSKDVRLLVACCIADVFRIFAPDAPYTEAAQLKVSNIFHSIIDVFSVATCYMQQLFPYWLNIPSLMGGLPICPTLFFFGCKKCMGTNISY